MKPILESSVVFRTLRWLAAESLLARALGAAGRLLRRVDAAFARAAADKTSRFDAARFDAIVGESRIVRAIDVCFAAPFDAWNDSKVRPAFDAVRAAVASMSPAERVRLLGLMIVVAVLTRGALYAVSGSALTLPTLTVWGVVILAGVVAASVPQAVATAWHEWTLRKR